jgi:hypothetical protein
VIPYGFSDQSNANFPQPFGKVVSFIFFATPGPYSLRRSDEIQGSGFLFSR